MRKALTKDLMERLDNEKTIINLQSEIKEDLKTEITKQL
jgi:hypothetical protein